MRIQGKGATWSETLRLENNVTGSQSKSDSHWAYIP